jgi:hypothetical protein
MNHVIIDKIHGIIFITLEPPSPIEVEFKELPFLPTEPPSLIENQLPLPAQRIYKRKGYPLPDPKIVAQGGYITSKQAASILALTQGQLDYLAATGKLNACRKNGHCLCFLLDDIILYNKNNK